MDKKSAYKITDNYFDSWLEQDKGKFLSLLHDDVLIQECTGDIYNNKLISKKWFMGWNVDGNKVLRWDIYNKLYDSNKETVIVEWEFECLYDYKRYVFQGVSIICFRDDLIYKLNEYQMNMEKNYPYND